MRMQRVFWTGLPRARARGRGWWDVDQVAVVGQVELVAYQDGGQVRRGECARVIQERLQASETRV